MDEQQRAAALMQARMARSNSTIPMDSQPPPRRRVRFDPRINQTPSQSPQQLAPKPPIVNPSSQITGSSMMIPPKKDPANRYSNDIEKMIGGSSSETESDKYPGINILVRMLVFALLIATVFVVPEGYKPFWITIVGVTILAYICMQLYYEWDRKAHSDDTEDKEKYKSWAIGMLYAMNMVVTAVVIGILIVMIWRIWSTVSKRSNLTSSEPAIEHHHNQALADHGMDTSPGLPPPPPPQMMERRKKKRRRLPFV
jgi:hypothetical protein